MDSIPTDPQALAERDGVPPYGQLALDFVVYRTSWYIRVTALATFSHRDKVHY
jgi:hypothetical protein